MDRKILDECFAATLDANPNVRLQAELQLTEASQLPGFINTCLDIILSQPTSSIQLSAAVYLKNKVIRNWEYEEFNKSAAIAEEEKPAFRERLIPAIINCPAQLKPHMVAILNKVITYDYPEKWPTFLDHTAQLLQSQDIEYVHAGLACLNEITKAYRWKSREARSALDRPIEVAFPLALQVGNSLLNENSPKAGEMMHLIMKCYRSVIALELSPRLQDQSSLVPWGTLLLQVVGKSIPADQLPEDEDDKEAHPWWKSKKWAYRNLNKLFSRYGDPSSLTDSMKEYKAFSKNFVANFATEIMKAYLHQTELWVQKTLWLSRPALYCILEYFEECVKTKVTWDLLKVHVDSLVSHVIYPLLCISDEDIELFDSEPVEYIHKRLDYFEDSPTTDIAAASFLVTLAERRRKSSFKNILAFINSVVVMHNKPQDELSARQKEGALRMIGSLSHIILGKKSPVAGMMEDFFVQYVFPDFQSEFGFLRVRACELLNSFSELDYQNPNNVSFVFTSVMNCLNDQYLPVQVEAALALQPLVRHESIRNAISADIRSMMSKLLSLTKKIDIDSLLGVMEDFVDLFSEQLIPFAVELAEELRNQFLQTLGEVIEKQNIDPNSYDASAADYSDDKNLAALGILNTLETLLLSLDSSPEVVARIEHAIIPVVKAVLENEQTDMYGEVFELVDSSSFCLKRITESLWSLFGLLHNSFKTTAMDYLDELLPALENYIIYGSEQMKANPNYPAAIVDIINTVFTNDERLGAMDRADACRLVQTLLLNLKGHCDNYIPYLISVAIGRLQNEAEVDKNKAYYMGLVEVVINCIYCNPPLALRFLEENNHTGYFFNLWFTSIESMTRVHDKKLSVMTIINVMSLPDDQIPASLQPGFGQLLHGTLQFLKTLPDAIKKREELSKKFEADEVDFYAGDDNFNTGDWNDEAEEENDADEPITNEYIEYLEKQASKLEAKSGGGFDFDDDYEELEEEPLYESPLDNVSVYVAFRDFIGALQQQPARNELLTKELTDEERGLIDLSIQQAFKDEASAAATSAAAS
ncbi:armadillo-type protein [Dipodascopsis tothii]|uniref:armadillo-type protein n=1 Tax=Dipodascopsis tothii TaxID=44089 RepID=UPI0034CDC722